MDGAYSWLLPWLPDCKRTLESENALRYIMNVLPLGGAISARLTDVWLPFASCVKLFLASLFVLTQFLYPCYECLSADPIRIVGSRTMMVHASIRKERALEGSVMEYVAPRGSVEDSRSR
jgi:hypothetical protein